MLFICQVIGIWKVVETTVGLFKAMQVGFQWQNVHVSHSLAFVCSSHLWNSLRYASVFRMKLQQTVHLEMITSMTVIHRVLKVFMIAPSLSLTRSPVRQMIDTKTEGRFWFVELFPRFAYLVCLHQQDTYSLSFFCE